jgi:hypothetical protein
VYILMINENGNGWTQNVYDSVVDALQYVRLYHHTRLVYPCGSIAEYVQGSLIDLR